MSNYPPGVSGNEPQITGEWPCEECYGERGEQDEDGRVLTCPRCRGTGIEPEELEAEYVADLIERTSLDRPTIDTTLDLIEPFEDEEPWTTYAAQLRERRADLAVAQKRKEDAERGDWPLNTPDPPTHKIIDNAEVGGAIGADGSVVSDADPGL
jgi:hypothetical protein